jgi:hypothetical protein
MRLLPVGLLSLLLLMSGVLLLQVGQTQQGKELILPLADHIRFRKQYGLYRDRLGLGSKTRKHLLI